jgi:hypothetical protein
LSVDQPPQPGAGGGPAYPPAPGASAPVAEASTDESTVDEAPADRADEPEADDAAVGLGEPGQVATADDPGEADADGLAPSGSLDDANGAAAAGPGSGDDVVDSVTVDLVEFDEVRSRESELASAQPTAEQEPTAGVEPQAGVEPEPQAPPQAAVEPEAEPEPVRVPLAEDASVEERVRYHVAGLDGIERRPLAEHAQRYDEVHVELQAALTEIDGESGG